MIPLPQQRGLIATLERAERPLLLCHQKPDGDAVGAVVGLGEILAARGQRPRYLCADPVPAHYRFLPGSDRFLTEPPDDYDAVVMLDCPNDDRTGFDVAALAEAAPLVDIDHHPKTTRPKGRRLAVYDQQASSASEMVIEVALTARWKVTRVAATALLTGIIFDTSAFQNQNTTAQTMRMTAELLRRGAKHKDVVMNSFYNSTIPKLKLWGTVMSRIEQNPDVHGMVSTVVTADDLVECGAQPDDLEGLVNFLNAIPGVPALMLLTDLQEGTVKGSFRTRDDSIDVNQLAGLLGGGGHKQAAGFSVPGRLVKGKDETWQVAPPSGVPTGSGPVS
jgi:phosphoesterase RecJ-like protein